MLIKYNGSKFITNKGLMYQKRNPIKLAYLQELAKMFIIPADCKDVNQIQIKKGLQYFIILSFWHSVLGPSKTLLLIKTKIFSKTLCITAINEMKSNDDNNDVKQQGNIPKDDPFELLAMNDNADMLDDINENIQTNKIVNWNNDTTYFVFILGALFNNGYYKENVITDTQKILKLSANISNKILQKQTDDNDQDQKSRINRLIVTLSNNTQMHSTIKFNKMHSTLEDVQFIRMIYHFIGVILSLDKSPFSILFHNPLLFNNGYVTGMPEDTSNALYAAMEGEAVWLCPNNHIYFVGNCTWTKQSSKCSTCGASIGNKNNAGSHSPADGNRRVGKIVNGRIKKNNNFDFFTQKTYNDDQMAKATKEELTPKGYVDVGEWDDICRNMNSLQIKIIRLFVNITLLIHHCCDINLSKLNEMMVFKNKNKVKIYLTLKKFCKRYIRNIGKETGINSNDDILYLIHDIIHRFYIKYNPWYQQNVNKTIININKMEERVKFEKFLNECINPTINDIQGAIQRVRNKSSKNDQLMRYWSKFMTESVSNKNNDDFKLFSKTFQPNLFLQFRFVTLSQFQNILFSLPQNEMNKIEKDYPIIFGILKCINLDIGYSIFALKYLPKMISWMKYIKSRLNQRIIKNDLIKNADKYNGQWALDKCAKNNWGDIDAWSDALKGFATGWNHVAYRIRKPSKKQKSKSKQLKSPNQNDDFEDEKDDNHLPTKCSKCKKDFNQNRFRCSRCKKVYYCSEQCQKSNWKKHKLECKQSSKQIIITTNIQPKIFEKKNPFKKLIDIKDTCEAITILKIEPKKRDNNDKDLILPIDIPLALALDSDDFDSSKMIRFMLQHLVDANNRLLRMCYQLQLNDDDNNDNNGLEYGLSPSISTLELSSEREDDVINIDEEELTLLIQQCTAPKLKYGSQNILDINSFNLILLETKLQQKYIIGRKFLKYDRDDIKFEFAGQKDISLIIAQINRKHKYVHQKDINYFQDLKKDDKNCEYLKFAIEQNGGYCDNDNDKKYNDNDDISFEEKELIKKKVKLKSYKNSIRAIEQTLIAISRLSAYPSSTKEISEYMKNTIHLYSTDYKAFRETKLKLKHMAHIWKYLNKQYIQYEDKWMSLPDSILHIYMEFINEKEKQHIHIQQFIASHHSNKLWDFLSIWRKWIQKYCKNKSFDLNIKLKEILKYASQDIDNDVLKTFPKTLKLSQIGDSYLKASKWLHQKINK